MGANWLAALPVGLPQAAWLGRQAKASSANATGTRQVPCNKLRSCFIRSTIIMFLRLRIVRDLALVAGSRAS
jgi:hypothetical protein